MTNEELNAIKAHTEALHRQSLQEDRRTAAIEEQTRAAERLAEQITAAAQQQGYTDQQVWLAVYCAAESSGRRIRRGETADNAVKSYRKRFPKEPKGE